VNKFTDLRKGLEMLAHILNIEEGTGHKLNFNCLSFCHSVVKHTLVNSYFERQKVHNSLEEKLGAIKCESGNVEVLWNNIKKCVLGTMSDLVGKIKRRARKLWITQQIK
jgi:hypothetical protein